MNITVIEYNSKTENLEISQGDNKIELSPVNMGWILKSDSFIEFREQVSKVSEEWR